MPVELTDVMLKQLEEIGYIIIPEYYTGKQLEEMQVAQRNILPTWNQVKNNPPTNRSILVEFPPSEISLLRGIVDHQAWGFGRKWLKTDQNKCMLGMSTSSAIFKDVGASVIRFVYP